MAKGCRNESPEGREAHDLPPPIFKILTLRKKTCTHQLSNMSGCGLPRETRDRAYLCLRTPATICNRYERLSLLYGHPRRHLPHLSNHAVVAHQSDVPNWSASLDHCWQRRKARSHAQVAHFKRSAPLRASTVGANTRSHRIYSAEFLCSFARSLPPWRRRFQMGWHLHPTTPFPYAQGSRRRPREGPPQGGPCQLPGRRYRRRDRRPSSAFSEVSARQD